MKNIATFIAVILLAFLVVSCTTPGSEPPAIVIGQTPSPTAGVAVSAPLPSPVATDSLAVPVELSLDALGNATYRGILDDPVTLTGGRYEGAPYVAGGASRPTVDLLPETVTYGDLDGDGQADASVVLVSDSGGSGTFLYLAVVRSLDGAPSNTATVLLGDREQVRSLVIDGDRLRVTLLSHAADDPACCPTVETTREFRLQGESLTGTD